MTDYRYKNIVFVVFYQGYIISLLGVSSSKFSTGASIYEYVASLGAIRLLLGSYGGGLKTYNGILPPVEPRQSDPNNGSISIYWRVVDYKRIRLTRNIGCVISKGGVREQHTCPPGMGGRHNVAVEEAKR